MFEKRTKKIAESSKIKAVDANPADDLERRVRRLEIAVSQFLHRMCAATMDGDIVHEARAVRDKTGIPWIDEDLAV